MVDKCVRRSKSSVNVVFAAFAERVGERTLNYQSDLRFVTLYVVVKAAGQHLHASAGDW